jgi:hypothetical protein
MFVNSVKTGVKALPGKSYARIDKRFVRTRVTSITISGMYELIGEIDGAMCVISVVIYATHADHNVR